MESHTDIEKSINPDKEPLTAEKVKTFEGFENVSDKEAAEIVYTIDTLCRIVYEYLLHQQNHKQNNQQNLAA